MGPHLTNYLSDLQTELNKSFGEDKGALILAEVYSHLDADIQARLELGSLPESVESEAVQAFGPVHAYVRALRKLEVPRVYRPFILACLSIPLSLLLAFLFDSVTGRVMSYGLLVAVLFYIVTSYLARRVQWRTLLVASALAMAYAVFYHSVTTVAIDGHVPNRVYRANLEDLSRSELLPQYEDAIARYESLVATHGSGSTHMAPVIPKIIPNGKVRLEKVPDAETAAARWNIHGWGYRAMLLNLMQREKAYAVAVEASKHRPWWRELGSAAPEALSVASQFLGILWLIHVAFALLGAATELFNRWYRRTAQG